MNKKKKKQTGRKSSEAKGKEKGLVGSKRKIFQYRGESMVTPVFLFFDCLQASLMWPCTTFFFIPALTSNDAKYPNLQGSSFKKWFHQITNRQGTWHPHTRRPKSNLLVTLYVIYMYIYIYTLPRQRLNFSIIYFMKKTVLKFQVKCDF